MGNITRLPGTRSGRRWSRPAVRARAGERNLTSSLTATDAITHAAVTGWTITAAQAVGLPATGAILVGFDVTDADALQHVIHGNGGIERPTPPVSGEPVQHIAASTEVKAVCTWEPV